MSAPTPWPARRRVPFLGEALAFRQDLLGSLQRGWYEQGDVARFRLAGLDVVGVNTPQLAEQVSTDSATFAKLGPDNPLRLALGDGLLTRSDHESWLRNRRMVAPIYHGRNVAGMVDSMREVTGELLDRWAQEVPAGATTDLHVELMHATLDIVSRCMFSQPMTARIDALRPAAVEAALTYTFNRLQNPALPPPTWPTPANRRFQAIIRAIDDMVYGLIRDRRSEGTFHRGDLLDMLLTAQDADTGEVMSDVEVRDEVLTTFAAGHETTAITMTWAMYLLSSHPEVRRAVQDEVDRVLGGRLPTVADLEHLTLVGQVFQEALRLYPSSPTVPREVARDVELGGRRLSRGTRVLINIHGIHRHPDHWDRPEEFDPERFSPSGRRGRHRWAHIPFGGGPHLCVGKQFALVEAQVLMAGMLARYDVRVVPSHPVEAYATITLRPRHGLVVALHPRTDRAAQAASSLVEVSR